MNKLELAWAAGFFDGEGCIYASHTNGKHRKGYLTLTVSQVRREPLDRYVLAVGRGKVCGPICTKTKPQYQVRFKGKPAEEVWKLLSTYVSEPTHEKYRRAVSMLPPYEGDNV